MREHKTLILFLVILALALVATKAAYPMDLTVSVSLSDTEWSVMRAYAAEQLRASSEVEIKDVEIDAEALRLCRAFAARGLSDVVAAQLRARLASLSQAEQEAVVAPVVSEKIVVLKALPVAKEKVVEELVIKK
jgi:hypothetical protein